MPSSAYHNVDNPTQTHAPTTIKSCISVALAAALILLTLFSALEMALVSSMVYWLHYRAGQDFTVAYNSSFFSLHGKPLTLLGDQGHTSNGAAGTAFLLVGLGGFLALWARGRGKHGRRFYHFWLSMTLISALLSLAAMMYTVFLTTRHANQNIDIALASTLHNRPYPDYVAYALDAWTPENWFTAVLQLPLAKPSEIRDIKSHLVVMMAWRWNLMAVAGFGVDVCWLACVDYLVRRRERSAVDGEDKEGKRSA